MRWIHTTVKRTEKNLPANGDLLTEEEIKKLLDAAMHPRDKAFIATLYESGARIGELASLQIKNVIFDENGAILNVTGKTGPRPIRIVSSTPLLVIWLQHHPRKNDKEAPLWLNIGKKNHQNLLRYDGIHSFLSRLFESAGINKRFNPHLFRHSRATQMAQHLTEFQMNQYFGWIQGSKMPATYVHMSGKNLDQSILAMNGLKPQGKPAEAAFKPKPCPRCQITNSPDATYCMKCAGILDIKVALELQEKVQKEQQMRQESDALMNLLIKDPDVLKVITQKIKAITSKKMPT